MPGNAKPPRATWRTLLKVFLISFRIGLFTFGAAVP